MAENWIRHGFNNALEIDDATGKTHVYERQPFHKTPPVIHLEINSFGESFTILRFAHGEPLLSPQQLPDSVYAKSLNPKQQDAAPWALYYEYRRAP